MVEEFAEFACHWDLVLEQVEAEVVVEAEVEAESEAGFQMV